MEENRKKIIVKEILFWKENRLLPEQYCNYLLALYTEGEENTTAVKNVQKRIHPLYFISLLPLVIFGYIYYFTEFSLNFQLVIFSILILLQIGIVFTSFKKGLNIQIPVVGAAFLILLISINTINLLTTNTYALFSIIAINCVLWIFIGRKWRLLYFTISGILGLVLIVLSFFLSF